MSTLEELLDPDFCRTITREEFDRLLDQITLHNPIPIKRWQLEKIATTRKNLKNKENARKRRLELKAQEEKNQFIFKALADENIRLALENRELRRLLDIERQYKSVQEGQYFPLD